MKLSEVSKYVDAKEQDKLRRRKRTQGRLSEASAALGLGALATRAPQAARVAAKHIPKVANSGAGRKLMALEPKATKFSEALVPATLGVGSASSMSFAGLQRREAKALDKNVAKRDDKFLRENRQHISTKAEEGYQHLRRGRNRRRAAALGWDAQAAGSTVMGGIMGAAGLKSLKMHQPKTARFAAAAAAPLATSAATSVYRAHRNAVDARTWDSKMDKIKAKAYERKAAGQYGRDRQADVTKAFMSGKPKIATPGRGGLMSIRNPRTQKLLVVTRRGAMPGTIGGTK